MSGWQYRQMDDIDTEWNDFLENHYLGGAEGGGVLQPSPDLEAPKCSEVYISTKTKIAFLSDPIDLMTVFWQLPVVAYQERVEGIIKKQMKVSCDNRAAAAALEEKIAIAAQDEAFLQTDVISAVDNPNARRVKFRDIRKINVGLCKKDLISFRKKKKGAFYNCFVVILRIAVATGFKEVHVKVFNTGKLEIPGIQDDSLLLIALDRLVALLNTHCGTGLSYDPAAIETVLINSNFSSNYYIDRSKFYDILKYKYGMHAIYDPCSYPGIQCKFYHNLLKGGQNGRCTCATRCSKKTRGPTSCLEVSFMIFRTGSILIVGHCDESLIQKVYSFLTRILEDEYHAIATPVPRKVKPKSKGTKPRRRTILVTK